MSVAAQASALPDVNAETYPFEMVQYLLDQTANICLYSIPDKSYKDRATLTPRDTNDFFGINGGYGIDLESRLHRFDSVTGSSAACPGVVVEQVVGEEAGRFHARCMFGPDDLPWAPGKYPPPSIHDPWRSQRFTMLDGSLSFGEHNVLFYGVGRTFPMTIQGKPLLFVGGVGNLTDGFGKFRGRQGSLVMTGQITPELGFCGNITCRIVDSLGGLRTDREIYPLTAIQDPDRDSTFIVMRGEKKNRSVKTTYGPPPGADLVSLVTPSQMRSAQYDFTNHGGAGPAAGARIGPVIADMEADVHFNLMAPPGTAEKPVPFTTAEVYRFRDHDGRVAGTILGGVVEGISFDLKFPAAPRQPGVRFAGFGPITGGTGQFEGAQGMLTVNSVIGIAPHVLSLVHVLHLADPKRTMRGRYCDV